MSRWASEKVISIRDHGVDQRWCTVFEITLLLSNYEMAPTVKSWFVGPNPQLGDKSPINSLREGRLKDAVTAARALTVGG